MLEERITQEGEHAVRDCKAMAEESRSGWNQVKEQALKINQGNWRKPKREVKRHEWEVRQDLANNEAFWRRCSCGFDEEGHGVALEFEAVKRVQLEQEHRSWLKEKRVFEGERAEQEEIVGQGGKRKRSTEEGGDVGTFVLASR